MAKHRLKQKKLDKGKQFDVRNFLYVPDGYVPVSHDAEARADVSCGKCGHPWSWHNRMMESTNGLEYRNCCGAYIVGLKATPCVCPLKWSQTYSGGHRDDLAF